MYQGPRGTSEANYVDDNLLQLWELNLEGKNTKYWNIQDVSWKQTVLFLPLPRNSEMAVQKSQVEEIGAIIPNSGSAFVAYKQVFFFFNPKSNPNAWIKENGHNKRATPVWLYK